MQTYAKSESGAVTVDWVVLTAALVGLGLATMAVVSTGVQDTSEDIEDQLGNDFIISTNFAPGAWRYTDMTGAYTAVHQSEASLPDGSIGNLLTISRDDYLAEYITNPGDAPEFLDEYVAAYEIMQERGLDIPEGYETPEEMVALWQAANGG